MLSDSDVSGNVVSGNEIKENQVGIYFSAGNQRDAVNIGNKASADGGNHIHGNGTGIAVVGDSYNLFITHNKIIDNNRRDNPTSEAVGLAVLNNGAGVDATLNYWGGAVDAETETDGPLEVVGNPFGVGNSIVIDNSNSQNINYRPFCVNDDCTSLSYFRTDPEKLMSVFGNGGTFTVPGPGPHEYNEVTEVDVQERTIIVVPARTSDVSVITIPAGTAITRRNGGAFDASLLSAADMALDSLSGFDSGTLVGAFQWGIPSIGLKFEPAIKIDMFVGTELAGMTLALQRSLSATGGWTQNGLKGVGGADDGTCKVDANGSCSFEATLASYYGALKDDKESHSHSHSSHGGDWANAKIIALAQNNTATTDAATVCPGNFTRSLGLGATGTDVRELQKYLNNNGYPVALAGAGSKGSETTYFGALTRQALALFQKARGLEQTGAFDAATMANLGCGAIHTQAQTAAANTSIKFSRDLELGATGDDVKALQAYLNNNGYVVAAAGAGSPGNETSLFGSLTRQALIKFQQAHNLPATGYFGPLTRAVINI